jgi:hypothetical protein
LISIVCPCMHISKQNTFVHACTPRFHSLMQVHLYAYWRKQDPAQAPFILITSLFCQIS